MTYHFRPLTLEDKPMFCAWLDQPHIDGWWHDGATEWALVKEDWARLDCPVDMRIVEFENTPFAYVQDYDTRAFEAPQYAYLPMGSRAIDMFLGAPEFLGKGHAAGFLRQRSDDLLAAAPVVAVDPGPQNTRAIATYARAGFQQTKITPCEDGDMVQV
ncbi:MAG: GNAT family N-acetyltransferase, partial [Planktomarina sp.]